MHDLLKDKTIIDFPNLHHIDAELFLVNMLERNSQPENKEHRSRYRESVVDLVETRDYPENKDIKLFAFDVDHTMALLYTLSSTTGYWAVDKLAEKHDIDKEQLFSVSREIEPEYLCHDIDAFMRILARKSGFNCLDPSNIKNKYIMEDWHNMRDCLNKKAIFRDVLPTFRKIKNEGGFVYLVTIAPKASVLHRLFLWAGDEAFDLIEGIAVRPDLEGMLSYNKHASEEEKEFVSLFEQYNKIVVISEDKIKPSCHHLNWAIKDMNRIIKALGGSRILPDSVVMVGDSLGTDATTAYELNDLYGIAAHFAWIPKGIVFDKDIIKMHEKIAHPKDILGNDGVVPKIESGKYKKPTVILRNLYDLFKYFKISSVINRPFMKKSDKVFSCDR